MIAIQKHRYTAGTVLPVHFNPKKHVRDRGEESWPIKLVGFDYIQLDGLIQPHKPNHGMQGSIPSMGITVLDILEFRS